MHLEAKKQLQLQSMVTKRVKVQVLGATWSIHEAWCHYRTPSIGIFWGIW